MVIGGAASTFIRSKHRASARFRPNDESESVKEEWNEIQEVR